MGEVIIKVKDEAGKEVEQKLDDSAVQGIVSKHSELAEELSKVKGSAEKLAVVNDFMVKYGLDPEGLVSNADGAFSLVNRLIEDGVIDTSGQVLVKKGGAEDQVEQEDVVTVHGVKVPKPKDAGDVSAAVTKAVQDALAPLTKGLEEVTLVQTSMLRGRWEEKIKTAYPNLTAEDVMKVLSEGAKRPREGLMDIAKEVSGTRSAMEKDLRGKHATEFGVNLEEFDANKLKEKGSEGGAAVMAEGVKFTLSKRRAAGDKTFADPEQATREYLRRQGILR